MKAKFGFGQIDTVVSLFENSKTSASKAHRRFVLVMSLVPAGRVASYGQIAKLAGYEGQARQVVWTLHSSSKKYKLPWHRIVNSKGEIVIGNQNYSSRQKLSLLKEGVEFDEREKINLKIFLWKPKIVELIQIFKKYKL